MHRELAELRFGSSATFSGLVRSVPVHLPSWRSSTIIYIKASCKNQLGDAAAYVPFVEKHFGKSSLSALTDTELQKVRVHVAGRKQSAKRE